MNPRRAAAVSTSSSFPMPLDEFPIAALGLGYINRFRRDHLSTLRPMAEFLDSNRLSKPTSVASMTSRLSCNIPYFRSNYILVFVGITAYSLVTNATLMFSAGIVATGWHFISKIPPEGIVIGEDRYNPRQLRTGLGCIAVPLFFYSSTLGTIFYIIGASAVSILGHAACMEEHIEEPV
ncbi:hypothetical protein BGZ65_002377 [Modicella reniformis]|uniref:PRA1 family protein n=1 Tax=Modicella reniformis TaxID=1440133 RepID=A0A9P6M9P6_9FUNG|nr:hypothetical protein BGZ65_002377 [Modicella reniformis]